MRYVVDTPEGDRLHGVKELNLVEAAYFRGLGYKLWPFDDGAWQCGDGHMFEYEPPPASPPWCPTIACRSMDFRWIVKDDVTGRDWL